MLLPAELAWYVTGRFYLDDKKENNLADYGYFLHLAGIDQAQLFAGKLGEGTACFTFAAVPFTPAASAMATSGFRWIRWANSRSTCSARR